MTVTKDCLHNQAKEARMTLADLERVAPAFLPHRSETAHPIDWDLLHDRLGTVLPADYREYAATTRP